MCLFLCYQIKIYNYDNFKESKCSNRKRKDLRKSQLHLYSLHLRKLHLWHPTEGRELFLLNTMSRSLTSGFINDRNNREIILYHLGAYHKFARFN